MSHSFHRWAPTLLVIVSLVVLGACSRQRPVADLSPIEREAAATARERGGSATPNVLSGDELNGRAKLRIEELIAGRIPGVRVIRTGADGFTVRIRGSGTFRSVGEPLFVVDGIELLPPASSSLRFIRPSDVTSIQVIKDGMASAYGMRGSSGVILITTIAAR